MIWELSLDGLLYLNGLKLDKKSTKVTQLANYYNFDYTKMINTG